MAYVTSSTTVFIGEAAPQKGFFRRFADRLIAARMKQAERQVEGYLARLPAAERARIEARLDAMAPRVAA